MVKVTDYEPYNPDITTNQSDILGYTDSQEDVPVVVENVSGMSRSWRPPYVLSPQVEQRIQSLKNTPLTSIINPMTNYERRFTRFNLYDMFVERVAKEFSKEQFNLYIDDEVQSAKSKDPHKYNYLLKTRPNREQSLSNFLYEFVEKALRNRRVALYIDKINYVMVNLPADLYDEHGQYVDHVGGKPEFIKQFKHTYGVDFKKENCYFSKYTQAGRGQMNYSFYWLDLVNLLEAQVPRGIMYGQGRIRPTTGVQGGVENTQAWKRLSELTTQLDKTSMGYMGTEERFQELFSNRVANAVTYLENQFNILQISSGISEDVLKGNFTQETWTMFHNTHIQPLVSFFTQTLTYALFTREAVLRGSRVEQNMFQPTPYDLGLLGNNTLVYDGRMTPNEIRGRIGMSTDNEMLDIHASNKNMQPISPEFFDAEIAKNKYLERQQEIKLELLENDHTIALEDTRKTTIASKAIVTDDGAMVGIADNVSVLQPAQDDAEVAQTTPPTGE